MGTMGNDHYFTASPESVQKTTELRLTLRGHSVVMNSVSGTFSPGSLDKGTAVLINNATPPPPAGTFLDIGCGWGPLAATLALESPAAQVWGIDVNERALDVARENMNALGLSGVHITTPEGIPEGVSFDLIWSNPPIKVGKAELHRILTTWLPRLTPEGEAWLVVATKLGGDSLQQWLNDGGAGELKAQRATTSKGYRLLKVTRA